MKFFKLTIIALTLFLLTPAPINAEKSAANDAVCVLRSAIQQIEQVMTNKDTSKDDKTIEVIASVKPLVNFELITKLSAGRQNWTSLKPVQRDLLVSEFTDFLINFYSDQLGSFGSQEIVFGEAKSLNPGRVEIPMTVNIADQDNLIVFKMHKSQESWKVYDFIVQGVSLVQTYRFQFDPYLKEGRLNDLIKSLNKK